MVLGIFLIWVSFITTVMGSLGPSSDWIDALDPHGNMKYEQLIDNLKFISEQSLFVRDDEDSKSSKTLNNLLTSVYDSGVITDVLYEIAQSNQQINNLVDAAAALLTKGPEEGNQTVQLFNLNISIDFDNLLDTVMDSGIISSTAEGLLMNDTNRETLGNLTGYFLPSHVWVGKLLNELGAGHDLTIDFIVHLIRTTPNKNPKFNSSIPQEKQAVFDLNSRDLLDDLNDLVTKANEGSASEFFSNLINGVLSSSLFSTSLSTVLNSLNDTGIVAPLAMDILTNDTIVGMFPKLGTGLYNKGALDGIDLNHYYSYAKKNQILSDFLQNILTSPKWEPPLALLLKQMDDAGVYKEVEDALFGPND